MSDYTTNDPRGWGGDPSRGAALGRPTIQGEPEGPITIRRSPLDRQGYDRNGTYFGIGAPLFWVSDEGGEVDYMLRDYCDGEDLMEDILDRYPNAVIQWGKPLPLKCWGYGEELCPANADVDFDSDYGDQCEECYCAEIDMEERGEW